MQPEEASCVDQIHLCLTELRLGGTVPFGRIKKNRSAVCRNRLYIQPWEEAGRATPYNCGIYDQKTLRCKYIDKRQFSQSTCPLAENFLKIYCQRTKYRPDISLVDVLLQKTPIRDLIHEHEMQQLGNRSQAAGILAVLPFLRVILYFIGVMEECQNGRYILNNCSHQESIDKGKPYCVMEWGRSYRLRFDPSRLSQLGSEGA